LLEEARERVVLVSPYVEARGVGLLFDRLAGALSKGVAMMLVTHDLSDIASTNSRAVEELRREAERVSGHLEVFSATSATGRDRERHPLLHAKLLIVDRRKLLLGSANLTSYGLSFNFEAGTLLGQRDAREADEAARGLVEAGLVRMVFRTGAGRHP
jgi:phosphatidylserine/phosphatidylglycerophosphate/cardiolipin synthase-like enzyme